MLYSQARFHLLRLLTQIEAKKLEYDADPAPDHTQGPEDVADRVRDSYMSDPKLLLFVGQGEGTYCLACSADCRGLRQGSGKKAGGIAWIKFQEMSDRIRR